MNLKSAEIWNRNEHIMNEQINQIILLQRVVQKLGPQYETQTTSKCSNKTKAIERRHLCDS